MPDVDGRIKLDSAIQLIFSDASKTMSDLKSRQWQVTTLSVAGTVGIATFSHGYNSEKSHQALTAFIGLILVGYFVVMWRCNRNLNIFRERLRRVKLGMFPPQAQELFDTVDEGSIVAVAYGSACVAFLFAILDIWQFFKS